LAALQQYWRGRLWPWRGCVLSSPALAPTPADAKPALITLALFLSRHFPKLQLTGLDVSGLSRCAAVVAHYRSDRLVWHGRMRARWAVEMMSGMACVGEELRGGRVQFPMLVLQGTDDRLVHAPGATLMHDLSVAQDKTMRIFEGGYHELLNDPVTQQQAMQDISEWITARMATRP
jgi:alpha-beta hydrolase superfamily lysophospholipase